MATQAASSVRIRPGRRAAKFYVTMGLIAAAIVFFGFARTYYLKEVFGTPALPILFHVHGLIMSSWIALLIVQSSLVVAHRTDIHRRLGVLGGCLAVLIVVVGVTVAIHAVRLGHAPPGMSPLGFLVIPLGDIFVFAALVGAALYYRRRTELHKRLMLIATIAILPAGIARWPVSFIAHQPLRFFGVADLILIACAVYDYAQTRRVSPAYIWGGLLLIASHPLRLALATTDAWLTFAHKITGI